MGALDQNGQASIPQDFKVSILDTTTIHPLKPTEKRSMFLSNIDQVLNFSVETIHFFQANADYPADVVVDRIRSALERLLVEYDFLAGRLRLDEEKGRLEIECNGGGVKFVVGSTELELDELGELEYPNPAFCQLAVKAKVDVANHGEDQPLCAVQVTKFKCGGFTMGISTDHSVFDGTSFGMFLTNLAAMSDNVNKPLPIPPYKNRELLAARSPPRVTHPHPELLKLNNHNGHPDHVPSAMLDALTDKHEFKLLHLSSTHISSLKEKARVGSSDPRAITSFNAVIAHIWRCKALMTSIITNHQNCITILYAVDLRKRTAPPLPASYTGNAVLSAYASAPCSDLENAPFSRIVEMVREGAVRMTDEYIRSVIDWGQLYKGFPYGDIFVSSWWKLGFEEVQYPWGKPVYSCPVVDPRKEILLLFPTIKGAEQGVNVLIALPPTDMDKFQRLFYEFLE